MKRLQDAASWQPPAFIKLLAATVKLSGQMSCVNVDALEDPASGRHRARLSVFARSMRVFVLLLLARMVLNIHHQYSLDFKLVQLDRLIKVQLQSLGHNGSRGEQDVLESRHIFETDKFEQQLQEIVHLLSGHNCTNLRDCCRMKLDSPARVPRELASSFARVLEAEERLARLGAPYRRAHFSSQVFYLLLAGLLVLLYYLNQFYFNHVQPLDMSLVKLILNRRQVQAEIDLAIRKECNSYLQSNINYLENFALSLKRVELSVFRSLAVTHMLPQGSLDDEDADSVEESSEDDEESGIRHVRSLAETKQMQMELVHERHQVVDQIRLIVQTGELQPANRKSGWLNTLMLIFVSIILAAHISTLLVCCLFFFLMPKLMLHGVEMSSMDTLAMCELLMVLVVLSSSGIFYNSIVFLNCADQVYATQHLAKNLIACLLDNRRMFVRIVQLMEQQQVNQLERVSGTLGSTDANPIGLIRAKWSRALQIDYQIESLAAQMNNKLMRAFIKFRLFRTQLRPVIQSHEYFATQLMITILFCPFVGTLHAPYTAEKFKWLVFLCSAAASVFGDCSLTLICHLHARCVQLYRPLSSLLAHAIEVMCETEDENSCWRHKHDECQHGASGAMANQNHEVPHSLPSSSSSRRLFKLKVYDHHLIWILYRELQYPDKMMERFAIKGWGLTFTYITLLKAHFWFSLIVLILLFGVSPDSDARHGVFGGLLYDPLGALNFK